MTYRAPVADIAFTLNRIAGLSSIVERGLFEDLDTDTVNAIDSLIHAGSGHDTFVFSSNFGQDTVTDFNLREDTIQLDQSEFANMAAVIADMSQHGGDTIITDAAGDTITLVGVTTAQLLAHHHNDFHLV